MTYRVIIESPAAREIDEGWVFIASTHSQEEANRWFNRLEEAILSLRRFPRRCPRAPESGVFAEEVRQLTCGVYRVLFAVRGHTVHVVHVRHTARPSIGM